MFNPQITGNELTGQIKRQFGMKDGRSKNSKLDFEIITRNIEYYTQRDTIDFRAREITLGIMWAYNTGRLNVDVEWAIRTMTAYKFAKLIGLVSDNCPTQNDIPRWLNLNEVVVEKL